MGLARVTRLNGNDDSGRWCLDGAMAVLLAATSCWLLALWPLRRAAEGIQKIQHVVIIAQENRAFDSYFGIYPAANGIPPGVCEPHLLNRRCVAFS